MPLEYFTPSWMTMFDSSAWRQLETVLQLDDMRQLSARDVLVFYMAR
jgi:hypothetical protein